MAVWQLVLYGTIEGGGVRRVTWNLLGVDQGGGRKRSEEITETG